MTQNTDFVSICNAYLKHPIVMFYMPSLWGYIIHWIGNVMEEKRCVFNVIQTIFAPHSLFKIEPS
jgi:hypothetical protein